MTDEPARTRFVYRSAITGRFVSRAYAEQHPDTTIRHTVTIRPRVAKET